MSLKWKGRAGAAAAAVLILAGLGADRTVLTPVPRGQKPMFPVHVRLEALGDATARGPVRLLATVTAWAPGEEIAWALETPPGIALLEGPSAWSGRLDRGGSRAFEIVVSAAGGGTGEVTARARIAGRPGAGSAATVAIDPGGARAARSAGEVVTGEGVTYIQYRGETRPRDGGER